MISYDIIWGSHASYDAKNASYDAKNASYEVTSPHMRSYEIIWCYAFLVVWKTFQGLNKKNNSQDKIYQGPK